MVAGLKNTVHEGISAMKRVLKYSPFIKNKLPILIISTTVEKLHDMYKECQSRVRHTRHPDLSLASADSLRTLLIHFEPQLPHMQQGDDNICFFRPAAE